MSIIEKRSNNPLLEIGIIIADECNITNSSKGLMELINSSISSLNIQQYEKNKKIIRDMLRYSGFKPTGRNKPASEYIINNAMSGNFPFIINAVDINNLISVLFHLPVSIVDTDRTANIFFIMEGKKDEEYVFNKAGQVIDIENLITVYDNERPIANPIKDSQDTKITTKTKRIAMFIYSSKSLYNTEQFMHILTSARDLLNYHLKANILKSIIL